MTTNPAIAERISLLTSVEIRFSIINGRHVAECLAELERRRQLYKAAETVVAASKRKAS